METWGTDPRKVAFRDVGTQDKDTVQGPGH